MWGLHKEEFKRGIILISVFHDISITFFEMETLFT